MITRTESEWVPKKSEKDFGYDVGWEVSQTVTYTKDGKTHEANVLLGYGLTEELARSIAQRLNG